MPNLLSIQVALPVNGSAFRKQPVTGPVRLGLEHLDGDDQGAKQYHGGPDRAVLAYPLAHYEQWRAEYPDHDWRHGAFGENFTVDGLTEATVCIGDRHRFGEVVLEVTCPRSPCMKIEQNNGVPGLLLRVRDTGRIGWLYRVIQQGQVEAGCEIGVEPGPWPQWTAARTMDVFTRARTGKAPDEGRELLACEALVGSWRDVLRGALN